MLQDRSSPSTLSAAEYLVSTERNIVRILPLKTEEWFVRPLERFTANVDGKTDFPKSLDQRTMHNIVQFMGPLKQPL